MYYVIIVDIVRSWYGGGWLITCGSQWCRWDWILNPGIRDWEICNPGIPFRD